MFRGGLGFLASQRASAGIEFALTVPVLLLFAAGTVEFGRAFQAYNAANRLATQYAISWSDCSGTACQTELGYFSDSYAIRNIVPQLNTTNLTLTMFQVSMSGTTPGITYSYPSGGSLTSSQVSAAQAAFSDTQSGVVVSVTYTHTLAFFQKMMTSFLSSYLTVSYTVTQLKS